MVRMKIIILKLLIFNSSNRVDRFFESGIYLGFWRNLNEKSLFLFKPKNKEHFKKQGIESNAKFFDNVDDYINEYTSTSDVKLANYQNIFLFYFLFCSLILLVFVIHCLIVYFYSSFLLFSFIIVRFLYLPENM